VDQSWFERDAASRVALLARHVPDRAAAIVDIGSGLTRLIPGLVEEGFRDVSALDVSAEAIARAVTRAGTEGVQWIVADVTRWRPPRRYGLWHDRAVLHFLIEDADREAYRAALLAATAPDSRVILSAFAPDGPERCSGLPVLRYGTPDFEALLGPQFTTLEASAAGHTTPRGTLQRFQTHVARRIG
jgi:SAM-dependent methyltransferase